jgi:hypothetical protein
MSDARRKFLTWIVLALLALWIAGQAVVSLVRYLNGREAHQRAEAWLQEAQDETTPDLTPDDAARWLKQHGVRQAYRGETAEINGKQVEQHIITGWRIMNRQSLWTEPLTAELVFHFDTNWRFTAVELEYRHFESD